MTSSWATAVRAIMTAVGFWICISRKRTFPSLVSLISAGHKQEEFKCWHRLSAAHPGGHEVNRAAAAVLQQFADCFCGHAGCDLSWQTGGLFMDTLCPCKASLQGACPGGWVHRSKLPERLPSPFCSFARSSWSPVLLEGVLQLQCNACRQPRPAGKALTASDVLAEASPESTLKAHRLF